MWRILPAKWIKVPGFSARKVSEGIISQHEALVYAFLKISLFVFTKSYARAFVCHEFLPYLNNPSNNCFSVIVPLVTLTSSF